MNMKLKETFPLLPPHGLQRPSLLAVGPFHQGSKTVRRIHSFMPVFEELRVLIPSVSFFLVGQGVHFCFSSQCPSQVYLVDFPTVPKEYIFYSNLFLDFGGKKPNQIESLTYLKSIEGTKENLSFLSYHFLFWQLLGRKPQYFLAQQISLKIRSTTDSLSSRFFQATGRKVSFENNPLP